MLGPPSYSLSPGPGASEAPMREEMVSKPQEAPQGMPSRRIGATRADLLQRPDRFRVAFGVRTRILAPFFVLLAVSALLAPLATRELLLIRLETNIEESLEQEVLELDRLLSVG